MSLTLDHLVLNAQYDTDSAAALLERLGFTLTPRGYHTLGSINHLILLGDSYLDILGLPADQPAQRRELLAGPPGFDGLVFGSRDIEASAEAIRRAGFAAQPVRSFSRPVDVAGQTRQASFSTVHLAADTFSAGRVYFCQHHTPELVWRDEWRRHRNGVTRVSLLTVITGEPQALARRYDLLGAPAPGFALDFLRPDEFAERYHGLIAPHPARASQFAALRLHGGDLPEIARQADALGLPLHDQPARLLVALPAFNCLFEFLP